MAEEVVSPVVFTFDAPYSGALRAGSLVFVSGQVPVDGDGTTVGIGNAELQARQVLDNVGGLLAAAGCTFADVVKLTYFVADLELWPAISAVRREYLTAPYPTSTAVEVSRLVSTEWLLEVEAVAMVPAA